MPKRRKPTLSELDIIEFLANKAKYSLETNWKEHLEVVPLTEGEFGSLRLQGNGVTREFYYLDGNTIAVRENGVVKYYLAFTDNLGSVMLSSFFLGYERNNTQYSLGYCVPHKQIFITLWLRR